ncbi:CoA pyrophosphatase [Azohydromonas caseinilytica]|uniref:CoA pyrophosphatase n=1 Tax=Azohydromonas caseinilytica TaxID=2728836 RepID=A0A848F3B4_9BURK|nr:CoA pyrophosphatase [Azohydromonas caseinilytica]NML14144.1 CoA pyrophosphatase [Azohydromonas caseinilytica]
MATLILDPQSVPVIGMDEHLPPVPPERLTAPALRQRFAHPPPWQPETRADGREAIQAKADASVLVPLVEHADGSLHVLLTQRTAHLKAHAGQISFPGGRAEPGDADAVYTALREAQEEVGLEPAWVQVIGALPAYTTITAFRVTPVVGLLSAPYELRVDPFEVAEAFEVPLGWLMTPAHHRHHRIELDGAPRQFLSMPWTAAGSQREYFIWGATAAMLRNLYRFLAA